MTKARAAATKNGVRESMRANSAPMAGPSRKPMPNAAPMRPMPCARSFGPVTSATYAWAAAYDAPAAPWSTRARKMMRMPWAKPIIRKATTVPTSDTRITGRRPWRSEMRPSIGATRNCMTAYEAVMMPI